MQTAETTTQTHMKTKKKPEPGILPVEPFDLKAYTSNLKVGDVVLARIRVPKLSTCVFVQAKLTEKVAGKAWLGTTLKDAVVPWDASATYKLNMAKGSVVRMTASAKITSGCCILPTNLCFPDQVGWPSPGDLGYLPLAYNLIENEAYQIAAVYMNKLVTNVAAPYLKSVYAYDDTGYEVTEKNEEIHGFGFCFEVNGKAQSWARQEAVVKFSIGDLNITVDTTDIYQSLPDYSDCKPMEAIRKFGKVQSVTTSYGFPKGFSIDFSSPSSDKEFKAFRKKFEEFVTNPYSEQFALSKVQHE